MITDHPNYATLTTLIGSLITKIRNLQAAYFVEKGRYFQGLQTPTVQLDGTVPTAIAYGLHPEGQDDSWYSFDSTNFNAETRLPIQIRLDIYESPKGWGWILKCELFIEGLGPDSYGTIGNHWVYQHNEGPDARDGVWDEWFILLPE